MPGAGTIKQTISLLEEVEPVTRNRSFEKFNRPDSFQAFRWYRLVKSLEDDLLCRDAPGCRFEALNQRDGQVKVWLEKPLIRYKRSCYLPRELFDCLVKRLAERGVALSSKLKR